MRKFMIIIIFIIMMIMVGCSNITKPETLVQLPDGYSMVVNLGDSLSTLFINDSVSSVGYQIRGDNGGMYFQNRLLLFNTERLMFRGQTDGYVNNPLLIHENPPFDKWLDFNFVIYDNETWPSNYHEVGSWYFNPDFWPELETCPVGSYVKYEWQINFASDGTYALRER